MVIKLLMPGRFVPRLPASILINVLLMLVCCVVFSRFFYLPAKIPPKGIKLWNILGFARLRSCPIPIPMPIPSSSRWLGSNPYFLRPAMANQLLPFPIYILFSIRVKIYVHICLGFGVFWVGEFASLAAALRSAQLAFHLGACACAYHMNVITHLSAGDLGYANPTRAITFWPKSNKVLKMPMFSWLWFT